MPGKEASGARSVPPHYEALSLDTVFLCIPADFVAFADQYRHEILGFEEDEDIGLLAVAVVGQLAIRASGDGRALEPPAEPKGPVAHASAIAKREVGPEARPPRGGHDRHGARGCPGDQI